MRHLVTTKDLVYEAAVDAVRVRKKAKILYGEMYAGFLGRLDSGPLLPVPVDIAAQWADLVVWQNDQDFSTRRRR